MNTKKIFFKLIYFLLFVASWQLVAYPGIHKIPEKKGKEITLGKKFMIIITADMKNLYGVSYFAVTNSSSQYKFLKFPVLLPKGVKDFEARDGVAKENFVLGDKGHLFIEKSFKPGMTLVGVDFKIPYAPEERGPIEIKMPFALEELSLSTPRSSGILFEADHFETGVPEMLSDQEYSGILAKNLSKNTTLSFRVKGLPDSHFFAQILGAFVSFFALLGLLLRFYFIR